MNSVILGAGAWGTALAVHLVRRGHRTTLVPRRIELALEMAQTRRNQRYLPDIHLENDLQIGFEQHPLLLEADVVFLAAPACGIPELAESLKRNLPASSPLKLVVSLAKGFHPETLRFPTDWIKTALPDIDVGVLSGPTNAAEVACGLPTAIVLGTDGSDDVVDCVQAALADQRFRVYRSPDVRGVELGGALKNPYAIGAGICDGLGLGDNAKAALLTRSLAELSRIGIAAGGNPETFPGLSGFGDLIATAYGPWSRNYSFGRSIGTGSTIEELMKGRHTIVEGFTATNAFHRFAQQNGIDAPILEQLNSILHGGTSPGEAISQLMSRPARTEIR